MVAWFADKVLGTFAASAHAGLGVVFGGDYDDRRYRYNPSISVLL